MKKSAKADLVGIHFAIVSSGGFANKSLLNLRTEIVLKDARDVAFWFSCGSKLTTLWQYKAGKRRLSLTHQTKAIRRLSSRKEYEWSENASGGIGPISFAAPFQEAPPLFLKGRFHFEFKARRYGGRK